MKSGFRPVIFIGLWFFCCMQMARAQSVPPDSITNPNYIKKLITYNKVYPFINYNQNFIEWCNYSAIGPFFEKLKQTPTRKLTILHIGDSHLQADILTGLMRNQIQQWFGYGGRGFVMPYAAAGTHSAYDYRTSCTGTWYFARNVQYKPMFDMGITGATVYTQDSSASFKFVFYYNSIRDNFTHLKIFLKQSRHSFNLKLKASGQADTIRINCNQHNELPYIETDLATGCDTLQFFMDKTDTCQHSFECSGMIIESPEDKGVLYCSVGINGAGLKSILRENILTVQLRELKPDLLIFDMGSNDFMAGKIYVDDIKKDLSRIIDLIRTASPETCIIITNCQDIYRRRRDVVECEDYANLTKEVAIIKNCAFYDYYNVSGNKFSMLKWSASKLAQYDRTHLTTAGYYVRGELCLNAILNSYYTSLIRKNPDTLLVSKIDTAGFHAVSKIIQTTSLVYSGNKSSYNNVDNDTVIKKLPVLVNTQKTYTSLITEGNETVYYIIKPGDNLGTIAQKFHVSMTQIKQWNSIKGTNIIAGKTLVIYKKKYYYSPNSNNNQANNNNTYKTNNTQNVTNQNNTNYSSNGKQIKHKVVSGDNMWDISRKYHVSMEQIRKLNNMKDNNLKIGSYLIISN